MDSHILFSPAKINLFFKVLAKRNDGYHEIVSLYQAISFFDTIELKRAKKDRFFCSDPSLSNKDNLVIKALDLYRKVSSRKDIFFDISLTKKIPLMAGLGGGSSNAASLLFGVNQMLGNIFSEEELKNLSERLGSDVSFFFSEGTALCRGRGEKIENFPTLPVKRGWIALPNYFLKTPDVYAKVDTASLESWDEKSFLQALRKKKLPKLFNDLEKAAQSLAPNMAQDKEKLFSMKIFDQVVMTGSGSAFVCLGADTNNVLKNENIKIFPFRSLKRKPGSWYDPHYES